MLFSMHLAEGSVSRNYKSKHKHKHKHTRSLAFVSRATFYLTPLKQGHFETIRNNYLVKPSQMYANNHKNECVQNALRILISYEMCYIICLSHVGAMDGGTRGHTACLKGTVNINNF